MTAIRQDAWTTDEDLILAEVVLRHIREGSTQLAAFEEVGKRLSRTGAACGFRWNSTIRKKYESAILLAKKQRSKGKKYLQPDHELETAKELQPEVNQQVVEEEKTLESDLTLEKAVTFLNDYLKEHQNHVTSSDYEALQDENNRLKQRLEKVEREKKMMEEDYRTLLSIMDRARKLGINDEATKEA
ncbi:RsfA family transcriptional regulator [Bacillus sp. JCM 19034]|uniref:RsfA family transcriptional regulator n=1 Tax=Bacillus sp. JCM 19034 TaxID=1481928 RepID=UPI00078343CD|nr:RsfA family transcriptional regulator [Bacillus sp. JCM 19034]